MNRKKLALAAGGCLAVPVVFLAGLVGGATVSWLSIGQPLTEELCAIYSTVNALIHHGVLRGTTVKRMTTGNPDSGERWRALDCDAHLGVPRRR